LYHIATLLVAVSLAWLATGQTGNLKKLYGDYVVGGARAICSNHQAIAILPADVSILYRKIEPGFTAGEALKQEQVLAQNWARAFYETMVRTLPDSNHRLIHPDTVAARFARAGLAPDSMHYYSRRYLAQIAGADALIQNDLLLSKQHTEFETAMINISGIFASIIAASGSTPVYIAGWSTPGTESDFSLSIYDGPTGMLLWMARTRSANEAAKHVSRAEKKRRRFPYVP